MKIKFFKRKLSLPRHTAYALLLLITAIIIHSCKKAAVKQATLILALHKLKHGMKALILQLRLPQHAG
jgi:hypothetical protein